MERIRVPAEDQLCLSGVVEKQDAVWWYGHKFIKLKISIGVPYTHVHMWNVLKAVHEVENTDAPWMEGCTLLWAGTKPGHTKKEKLGTWEMIIILLCQLYMKWSEVAQSCLTLSDPMDCSLPGSSVRGTFQAIVLEWIAISFSRGIFPTQGLNPGLPHCRQTLYHLSHQGRKI